MYDVHALGRVDFAAAAEAVVAVVLVSVVDVVPT